MLRSMFAAISGLKSHQTMLDVTANDIANVNTIGFKAGRTTFKDSLAQMQSGAAAPNTAQGGANARQIGLGVQLGSIDNLMSGGALQSTGNVLDVAIQGEGWFRIGSRRSAGRADEPAVHPRRQLHDEPAGLPRHAGRRLRHGPHGPRRRRHGLLPADPARRDERRDRPGRLGLLRPGRRRRARRRGLHQPREVLQRGRPRARLLQPLERERVLRRRAGQHARQTATA